jgi:alkylation response protein AidB-like acyl-CoA dehydrogenase
MDFNLTEEQQMLQDTLARLVREQYGFEAREGFYQSEAGFSSAFWQQLAELGLTAVPFGEAHGGFGGGGVDNMVIMTELGRGLCLEPFLHSQIFAGGLLQQLANLDQQEALMPPLVSGELHFAVAFEEPQSHYRLNDVACRAEAVEGGWRISGRKSVVIGGESAGRILLSARTGGEQRDERGISLFVLDPAAEGVSRRGYPCIDGPRACDLQLENVFVASGALLGQEGQALDALRFQQGRAIAAQCAEALGSMEEIFALTLDYLKTRKQFGRLIGEFQVLQHRMADICGELEQARSMAIMAACVADEPDSEDRSRRLAAAKYILSRAARFIAEQAIQLHGGIGMTWEFSLSHHAKRLVMLSHQFGDDDHHLGMYAGLMQTA